MIRMLAIVTAPLLLAAAQEDAPIEMKWDLKKEDRLDLKWSYSDQTHHELPRLEGRTEAETVVDTYDRREVEAELYLKDDTPAGTILIALKKVAWTQGTGEYEVSLGWMEGKKAPEVQSKIKVKDKSNSLVKREEAARATAAATGEAMKKLLEGAYALNTAGARKGETLVLRNNAAARVGNSIFDKLYLHSPAPTGSVALNQAWKDPLEGVALPPGLVEVDTLSWKITACGAKTGATAKAGFTFPINKAGENVSNNQVTDVKTSGTFTLAREYTFSAEAYLASSKEEITFNKKTDAKGKDADFYKDTQSRTCKQALTIKKKKVDDRKKAEEKK